MEFTKCEISGLDRIMELYDLATAYQKTKIERGWLGFDRNVVAQEIQNGQHWKIIENGIISCIFVSVFNDPFIWGEKNKDKAVYLHRISTNPDFRGRRYVEKIVAFCKAWSKTEAIDFIRMDTHSGNDNLNKYYESCGFTIAGTASTDAVDALPAHYQNESFTLFEIKI